MHTNFWWGKLLKSGQEGEEKIRLRWISGTETVIMEMVQDCIQQLSLSPTVKEVERKESSICVGSI
jgi:hypothetical protein